MLSKKIIKCPYCGYEYLPSEIFYPDDFLGKPQDIIKDENGVILGYNGSDMLTSETYVCDKCGKNFAIDATISFKTSFIKDIFEEDNSFFNGDYKN